MASLEQVEQKQTARQLRYFSDAFKRKKVQEIDQKITTVAEICRVYQVSNAAVYKWIYKYSLMKKKGVKMIVEAESDTARIKALQDHIAQLEQMLGAKQFEIDFMNKQMEIISEQYGVDLKKKASGKPSSGSGSAGKNTPTQ